MNIVYRQSKDSQVNFSKADPDRNAVLWKVPQVNRSIT